ncbi:bacteriophage holin [Goodfellowiella coeruleoviolacea]|uniref:bacteriophage holin n=1 Tax=Goodfellowiella coeruleoviolacea TaxID=334858 RepID=UPI0020A4448C|nr:bacteriophage holin [Goodfellowiella coeruleoviolacea]
MPYLSTVLIVAVGLALGLAVLAAVGIRVFRSLRRFASTSRLVNDQVGDDVGLLKARSAALRVAVDQRRRTARDR